MTSSGSVNFDLTRNEIINDALVLCGAIEAGESPAATDTAYAARQLNRMVKSWQAAGTHLWSRRECYLFLSKGQASYRIGPNSTDHTAEIDDAVRTQLSANAALGAGSVSVDSTAGIAVSDNIGVVLDDGTIDWFTVSAIPGAITLSGTLTGAASENNQVFAYTSKIVRPLRIIDAQLTDEFDSDTPIIVFSHEEYQQTPNKTGVGRPNELYYHPRIPDGSVYVWQAPSSSIWRVRMTCLLPLEDFDTSANTADMPQEWLDALVWGLARRLGTSYGTPALQMADITQQAGAFYTALSMWDQEPVSVFFSPAMME
jgi:hypothetical protein